MHVSADNSRLPNLLGALCLAVTDQMASAGRAAVGLAGSGPAALLTLYTRPGISIESLRQILGISQPATVRVVDRLVAAGLVTREPGPDGRTLALRLTAQGRERAQAALASRLRAARTILDELTDRERDGLSHLLDRMLGTLPATRDDARHLCRLCDHSACSDPYCPVDLAVPSDT
jgi:MarR family transcriptional regulator, negative regulator of the multidrug operon emrRAB